MLGLCEEFSLASASLIVVVSEVLRDELVKGGIPASNIIVNPNGVDPFRFYPGCGGDHVREDLAVRPEQVLAGFVGTFSYWHGVEVLQEAILKVLDQTGQDPVLDRLKFLLIGTGPLFEEMRTALSSHPKFLTRVDLPGSIAHELVPSYLDAADILLSPHSPMLDGRPFFGSPTKLFEYMAVAKGIVASRLDQIAAVLEDHTSALLITPGSADELVCAMRQLAADSSLRERLGRRARERVMANFTWAQNAGRVLQRLRPGFEFEECSDKGTSHLAPSEFTQAS
jgi:glycosyltransferase involved in cell wall biosynthesis